jgi:hypothetical protein
VIFSISTFVSQVALPASVSAGGGVATITYKLKGVSGGGGGGRAVVMKAVALGDVLSAHFTVREA